MVDDRPRGGVTPAVITAAGVPRAVGTPRAARWPRLVADAVSRVAGVRVVASIRTAAPLVALTVDDGPHPATTPALLDVLAEAGARATFFLIGEHAERHPGLVRRIAAEGHELGNHLLSDTPSVLLPAAEFDRQLDRTHQVLAPHGEIRWFRPGSGWFTPRMLRAGARRGYGCALGSPGLAVAAYPRPRRIAVRLAARCGAGDVVVLHEGTPARADVGAVAQMLIRALAARGLRTATISALLAASCEAPHP